MIFLNAGRISLLAQARDEGRRVVLVTDELSCLTPAFAEVWREAGAVWVVRSPNGLREGFTGRRLSEVGEVFTAPGSAASMMLILAFCGRRLQLRCRYGSRLIAASGTGHDDLGGPMDELAKIATGVGLEYGERMSRPETSGIVRS